jgi:hypothetical protein
MPVKAPEAGRVRYNWSGFYIGAHGGGGWSEKCFTFINADDGCHNGDGFLAGGQVGFNYQANQFVFGAEFSGSWADITGDHRARLAPADTYRSEINSILMLTGRVGLAFDRMLRYVTGGGAWAHDKFEYVDRDLLGHRYLPPRRRAGPAGPSVPASSTALRRTGRSPRNTTSLISGDKNVSVHGRRRELHRQRGPAGAHRDGAAQLSLRRRPGCGTLLIAHGSA